jgi:hypothetical protein
VGSSRWNTSARLIRPAFTAARTSASARPAGLLEAGAFGPGARPPELAGAGLRAAGDGCADVPTPFCSAGRLVSRAP